MIIMQLTDQYSIYYIDIAYLSGLNIQGFVAHIFIIQLII